MGCVDSTDYGISTITGVVYCPVDRVEPGGLFEQLPPGNSECIFQDALGEYYFYYQFS
jgi:hypothetical protein